MSALETYEPPAGVMTSRLPGFYKLSIDERIDKVANLTGLSDSDVEFLKSSFSPYFPRETADKYIENCIAGCDPPMGVVTNAKINGKEYIIPMRAEEPSIVAAASSGFLEGRDWGFEANSKGNSLKGQMYIKDIPDPDRARQVLEENIGHLYDCANKGHKHTYAYDYEMRLREDGRILFDIVVETHDVQGANVVNLMCEAIQHEVEKLTCGKVVTGILTNYADRCIAEATMRVPIHHLARPELGFHDAEKVLEVFLDLSQLGLENIERATTHNKGIMNGIDAVALATGNDWRALEAGAHAYAARLGQYRALSEWRVVNSHLEGHLRMPLALGTVRGATGLPFADIGLKILGNPSAPELQKIIVATGLANNYAAIHTLVTDGINRGHLELHNKRPFK